MSILCSTYLIIYSITTLLCVAILLVLWFCYKTIKLDKYNQAPLDIRTFDGHNSPYHPAVLYFKDGWNGWKYWMAETPYHKHCKPYRDRNECPSIHVSNDGYTWTEPDGLVNPIVNFGEEGEKNLDYYSDPHLVYFPERDEVECWYRFTERNGKKDYFDIVSLRKVKTKDGVNWSNEEIISQLNDNTEGNGLGKVMVSPAILFQDNKYKIWYVDSEIGNNFNHSEPRDIVYSESSDGYTWADKRLCILKGLADCNPWHIDVAYIDGIYYLTVYGDRVLRLYKSKDGIRYDYIKELLSPAPLFGSFYAFGLYRSCLVKSDDKCHLYFSADDGFNTHIGLMEGANPESMNVIKVGNQRFQNPLTLMIFYIKKFIFIIKNLKS